MWARFNDYSQVRLSAQLNEGYTMANKENKTLPERLNRVGGQAVLEGVMMKAGTRTVTTCRKEDGSLVVTDDSFVSIRKKYKILDLPIIRGVVGFIESLILSVKTLNASADALGLDEEESESGFERWLKKHLGVGITDVIMVIGTVLGLLLSLFLFMFLPTATADGINALYLWISGTEVGIHPTLIAVIEGVMKVVIFVVYLVLVSLIPDIKRTFMYHGAEHKTIACFEAGEELTPENAMKHRRFHPRCGTSFMFLMIIIGIIAGMFVRNMLPGLDTIAYSLIKILILPLTMGVGYEILMLAGKHDNLFTRIISAPGLWVQRITTKEPTLDMLEVAIVSTKCALRDDFPEFKEYFDNYGWESPEQRTARLENEAMAEALADEVEASEERFDNENEVNAEALRTEVEANEERIDKENEANAKALSDKINGAEDGKNDAE